MTSTPPPPGQHIACDAELQEHWERLMGRGGFGRRSLWLVFLDATDHTLPVIVPIDDIPQRPDQLPGPADNLMNVITALAQDEPGLGVAMLLSRPGPGTKTEDDRAWAACLVRLAREHGVRMWPVHLATADRVQVMAADDLVGV